MVGEQKTAAVQQQILAESIARHQHELGALLPVLHDIQDELGYVPDDLVPHIASALNLSRAEVHGVISYYQHFHRAPHQGQHLQICRAEACQAMGSSQLWQHACHKHNQQHTVEAVYCLGLCANAPAAMINERLLAEMTPEKLDTAVAKAVAVDNQAHLPAPVPVLAP